MCLGLYWHKSFKSQSSLLWTCEKSRLSLYLFSPSLLKRRGKCWLCFVCLLYHHCRFFVLNNDAGLLEYFVNEQSRHLKPRGTLQLAGAVISPSDEDSHTFTVNAASGEQYKLRGRTSVLGQGTLPLEALLALTCGCRSGLGCLSKSKRICLTDCCNECCVWNFQPALQLVKSCPSVWMVPYSLGLMMPRRPQIWDV